MLFDDRLATVLRAPAGGERSARTQFRQLLDLLGTAPTQVAGGLIETGYARLAELTAIIPAEEQSRILREPGLRLRNRQLVAVLAGGEAKPAAAALATARLSLDDWLTLVPELPIVARGFLRHRRDLPGPVRDLLDRLGVRDFVLPQPDQVPPADTESDIDTAPGSGAAIRNLLRRIEAFREGRRDGPGTPRLPLGDTSSSDGARTSEMFEFTSDAAGRIDWASAQYAPLTVGMTLAAPAPGIIAALDPRAAGLMRLRQPLDAAVLRIDAHAAIAGEWRVDAEPVFAHPTGAFAGYRGRIRRPHYPPDAEPGESAGDRMRQALHELRTPVNAIQGFAEIIQQQLFGAAPNEYRALAAAVAVDAAKLLAAFDEIDRLARLETGALEIEPGEADMRTVVGETVRRLQGALSSRGAGFDLTVSGSPFIVGLDRGEAMTVTWRVLATLAGALAQGEQLALELTGDGETLSLAAPLPASLAQQDDPFAIRAPGPRPALSAGMFGSGFSLRLARAEIVAAGGTLEIADSVLEIHLPLLTDTDTAHTSDGMEGAA